MRRFALFARSIMPYLFVALLPLISSCGQETLSPEAESFRQDTVNLLNNLVEQVKPYMAEEQDKQIGEVFEKAFDERSGQADNPLHIGLVAFNAKGHVLVGRYPKLKKPDQLAAPSLNYNYANYKGISKVVIDDGKTSHLVLYSMNYKIFVVCKPVKDGKKVLGAVCMGCSPSISGSEMPVSEKEFKDMRFD